MSALTNCSHSAQDQRKYYWVGSNAFLTVSCLEGDRASVNSIIKPVRAAINLNYISGSKKQKGVSPDLIFEVIRNFS
jgi:hypothetical protein